MFNNIYNNKYLRYTNSESADDENDNNISESENNSRNIESIVNKLENKINPNNEFNLKMTSQYQETTRTSKMNESNMNNLSDLVQKNIKIKDNENSIDIGDSLFSVNSIPKSIKMGKSLIDIDISLNNNNLNELQKEEKNEKEKNDINKLNLIQMTNNSNYNMNRNNKNNLLSRNKILNTGTSLNTLSTHLDNSKYFLTKTNGNLIVANKIKKNKDEIKKEKENNIDLNLKLSLDEDKNKEKETKIKNNSNLDKNNKIKCFQKIKCNSKKKNKIIRRRRKCNFITLLRNFFLTIIIVSAIGFYVMVFIS